MNQKKILIIEDEEPLLYLYKTKFKKAGYNVLTANNGVPGEELAKLKKPDLVLLDIVMPQKDGYEVLKTLKSQTVTKKIPIIILSNLGQKEEIARGMELGADSYLVKSGLTPTEVVNKVDKFFVNRSGS